MMKKAHLCFGIAVILHFLVTGLFMAQNSFSLKEEELLVCMMLRANHVYILFSGFSHVLLSYFLDKKNKNYLSLGLQLFLMLSTILLNVSFYIEPIKHLNVLRPNSLDRQITAYGIQLHTSLLVLLVILKQYLHRKVGGVSLLSRTRY